MSSCLERIAKAMQQTQQQTDVINLSDVMRKLIVQWRLIVTITFVTTAVAVVMAFVMTPIYEGKVVMMVAKDDDSGKLQSLGGVASRVALGSLGLGLGGQSDRKTEAIATLQSRVLTDMYVKEQNLLPILFSSKWDPTHRRWKDDDPNEQPTLWDANKLFVKQIRSITDDSKTGLVTLVIAWKDKRLASQWANDLVARTNAYLRQRALNLSAQNLTYLNEELKRTNVVELQQAIYSLIEAEIKKTMLARGNEEYAFKVLDPAVIPQERSKPKRLLIIALGFFGGLGIGFGYLVLARSPP